MHILQSEPATTINYTDHELLDQFNQGNMGAFKVIYQRYFPLLFNLSYKMTRDQHQSEDIVHDIFENMLQKKGVVKVEKDLSCYLYQSVRFKIIDVLRKSKLSEKHLASLRKDIGHNNTEEMFRLKELESIIEKEVSKLPHKMREVFDLSRKGYLSYQEIAIQRHTSVETVRKQLYLTLKVLKGIIGFGN